MAAITGKDLTRLLSGDIPSASVDGDEDAAVIDAAFVISGVLLADAMVREVST